MKNYIFWDAFCIFWRRLCTVFVVSVMKIILFLMLLMKNIYFLRRRFLPPCCHPWVVDSFPSCVIDEKKCHSGFDDERHKFSETQIKRKYSGWRCLDTQTHCVIEIRKCDTYFSCCLWECVYYKNSDGSYTTPPRRERSRPGNGTTDSRGMYLYLTVYCVDYWLDWLL